jgi:hypothetical protein
VNWFNLSAYTLVWASIFVVWLRIDRRARWASLLFYTVPGIGLLCFWAVYRGSYLALGLGLILGLVLTLLWWLIWGRRIPPSDSSQIKVWGQEK